MYDEDRKEKLKLLLKFYNTYKDDTTDMCYECPYGTPIAGTDKFDDTPCNELCFSFELLDTTNNKSLKPCPCGWFGQKKAIFRLELTLRMNNMLEKEE
jgi:hypothetical protein